MLFDYAYIKLCVSHRSMERLDRLINRSNERSLDALSDRDSIICDMDQIVVFRKFEILIRRCQARNNDDLTVYYMPS